MKGTIYITLCLLINIGLYANNLEKDPYVKFWKIAEDYLSYGDYTNALPFYLKADSVKSGSAELDYKIGMCYIYSPHHEKALPYLEKAYEEGYRDKEDPEMEKNLFFDAYESQSLFFNLGRAYHWNYKFDQAIRFYVMELDRYEIAYQNPHEKEDEKKVLENFIRQAERARVLIRDTVEFVVKNLGPEINTKYEELAPQISSREDMLIFTAASPTTTSEEKESFGEYMEDIYISYKTDNKWGKPVSIKNVNTKEHDAAIGLSPDGDELLIYRNNNHMTGDIYLSTKKGKTWSIPTKMPEGVNTKYLENSASMTQGGRFLYFTSNRFGGLGGEDIYMCERKLNGQWSEPKNLGSQINTPYDDDAPFITPDGKILYFSSKGHNSMGGFDIFKSTYDESLNTWTKPVNMGFPINTPEHDIFFVWSQDGQRAYFSSHRQDSYGMHDIYMMTLPKIPVYVKFAGLNGTVENSKGKSVRAEVRVLDFETGNLVAICNTSSKGDYKFKLKTDKKYKIQVSSKNTLPYEETMYFPQATQYYDATQDVILQLPKKGLTVTLKNVHFDYNKSTLRPESFSELDNFAAILKEEDKFEVEISGHTDDVGSDEYNLKLSLRRAQIVVDYLVTKGVDKDKIFAVGYGETSPVATNNTEEGRQENRRTDLTLHDDAKEGFAWKRKKKSKAKILLGQEAKEKK